MDMPFGQFVLIEKHSVAAINVSFFKFIWCSVHEPASYFFLWMIVPWLWQDIFGIMYPRWAGFSIRVTKMLNRGSAISRPPLILKWGLREWIDHQIVASFTGIVPP